MFHYKHCFMEEFKVQDDEEAREEAVAINRALRDLIDNSFHEEVLT